MSKRPNLFSDFDDAETPAKRPKLFELSEEDGVEPVTRTAQDEDEEDPLDAFMAGIETQLQAQPASAGPKIMRQDIEEDDPVESFLKHRDAQKSKDSIIDETEYDSDDMPIMDPTRKKKPIESLAPLDHSLISYEPFEKNFYEELEDIATMSEDDIIKMRRALSIRVEGDEPIRPVRSFSDCGFDTKLLDFLTNKLGFSSPTPIQRQALPIVLAGRDMIGIAQTGSGKTLAYVLPMLIHILDQRVLEQGEGPIAIIAAPTRELAHQIHSECTRAGAVYGIKSTNLVGGLSKGEQWKQLRSGCGEIVVCTPGRLIDMIKMKAIKPYRTTMLVLDEADKMFDMGFEPQVRSIVGQIRPDRQTLLFSATFGAHIESLAREVLTDPLRVTVGTVGSASEDVEQIPVILTSEEEKWSWLSTMLRSLLSKEDDSVLIFGSTKGSIDMLTSRIANELRIPVAALHGDKDMNERLKIMHAFKTGAVRVLVATDVASRGLDVKSVRFVINYHLARDIDSHTHRIGRTGRAGVKGIAYSLLVSPQDAQWAGRILNQIRAANKTTSTDLTQLAMRDPRFRKSSQRRTRGSVRIRGGNGRSGIGFSSRREGSPAVLTPSQPAEHRSAVPPPPLAFHKAESSEFEIKSTKAPNVVPAATLSPDIAAGLAKWQMRFQNSSSSH